jgi:hypothetical protein
VGKPIALELDEKQAHEYARAAYIAAVDARRELEEQKRDTLQQYRIFSAELANGGRGEGVRGQFGWSKITVPVVFWITETVLPRVVLNVPTVVVTAQSPPAVPYAMAKQQRIKRQMHKARMKRETVRALKQTLLYGDGPVKVTWNRHERRVNFESINWFDFILSAGASRHWNAEWVFHRVRYTPHDLVRLSRLSASDGKPLYKNLEYCTGDGGAADDPTRTERLATAGLDEWGWYDQPGLVELIECHHRDGSIVTLGPGGEHSLRVSPGPYKLPHTYDEAKSDPEHPDAYSDYDDPERPAFRPFAQFQNTPDVEGPYGIGDAEMQQDYQRELSTVRRQSMDQVAANIHAPIAYNSDVAGGDVDRAFEQPGGKIRVNGDVRSAIARLPGGQLSQDVERISDMLRTESQLVSGVNDFTLGAQTGPGLNETATGVVKTIEEGNQRWRFKQHLIEQDMGDVACIIDWLDRQYGSKLTAPHDPLLKPPPNAQGIQVPSEPGGVMVLGTEANEPGAEYEVEVEAGSMMPASKQEKSQNILALVGALAAGPMAPLVDWRELTSEVIASHGIDPDRLLLPAPPTIPGIPPGATAMPGIAGENGNGLVPVGEPTLIE